MALFSTPAFSIAAVFFSEPLAALKTSEVEEVEVVEVDAVVAAVGVAAVVVVPNPAVSPH